MATTIRLFVLGFVLAPMASIAAEPGNEFLLPDTTKLFISLPHPDVAREKFNASQFGELVNHEKMAKFMDALEEQYKDSGRLAERLGIAPADLDGVYDGEVSLAVIQPGGDRDAYATALIMKIRPGDPGGAAFRMLNEIVKRRLNVYKGSKTAFVDFDPKREKEVYKLTTPADGKKPPVSTCYFFQGDYFVAVDHEEEARAIYKRIADVKAHGQKAAVDSLGTIEPFQVCMARVATAWGAGDPQVRWFLEPFNYLRVTRAEQIDMGARKRKPGRDMIDVYADEGFDAIGGIGGWLNFSEGEHEALHRTFVYAPAVDRKLKDPITAGRLKIEAKVSEIPKGIKYAGPDNDRYLLGARMMHFFNDGKLKPLDWVPDDIATHMAFHWHMQRAFKYSETLVNAYSDDVPNQEVWWGTIDSIRDDEDGPMVDIRKDIVMHIGTRATYISDYARPIDIDSEQTAVAMEIVGDAKVVAKAIDQMMANDPDAKKHVVGNTTVWEVVPPPAERGEQQSRPASYMVAYGHLFRAPHAEILKKLANMPAKQLAKAEDLQKVNAELDKLSDDQESFRYFDRLDRSMEQNWVLIQANKFPQSDSLLANMAARSQGLDPTDEDTKKRKQAIDGKLLPDFEFAKAFLGASGFFVKGMDDGWLVTGAVLTK